MQVDLAEERSGAIRGYLGRQVVKSKYKITLNKVMVPEEVKSRGQDLQLERQFVCDGVEGTPTNWGPGTPNTSQVEC